MQRTRRTDPYPYTWEIPVGVFAGVASVLFFGLLAGRAIANLFAGNGWVFVADREHVFAGLGGLLHGHSAAGLSGIQHPATPTLLWICGAVVELALIVGLVVVTKRALARWGPSRVQGMATTTEAERVLGRTRLRRAAPVVRPDLYGKHAGVESLPTAAGTEA
ncbi:hypothetical protein Cch01nite_40430 [Cellulomonas chitinilytica]|uniref:Conjugal transfer protein n=1 Tax=Cellulomonas chitinilytica TaxID=398759 RepID=A0A919U4N2_9CELL|nr:hypothetical protein [Cellulomonas chitinilytica]GIG23319.1 hypothetical protein Cch01nite_40430 [Cellulomonas chitinilytica]